MAKQDDLDLEVANLIAWVESFAADDLDIRETCTYIGIKLGQRGDQARMAELGEVDAFHEAERIRKCKDPIIIKPNNGEGNGNGNGNGGGNGNGNGPANIVIDIEEEPVVKKVNK